MLSIVEEYALLFVLLHCVVFNVYQNPVSKFWNNKL